MKRYKILPKDAEIDPESALLQGANALDAAGETAERMNDVEGLLNVAAMWMKFSEQIVEYVSKADEAQRKADHLSKEGEIVKTTVPKIDVGFRIEPPAEPEPDAEEITVEDGEEID